MRILKPGAIFRTQFETRNNSTKVLQDADSPPSCTASLNGTDDAGFSIAVTKHTAVPVGFYDAVGTVPLGYTNLAEVSIRATATVGGFTDTIWLEDIIVSTKYLTDLQDLDANTAAAAVVALSDAGWFVSATVNDSSPTATAFKVAPLNLSNGIIGSLCEFKTGVNAGLAFPVTGYSPVTGLVTFTSGFPVAPANTDSCRFIGRAS